MPIYEFRCKKCGAEFEAIRPMGDDGKSLICQECGAQGPEKRPSVFAASCGGTEPAASCGGGGFT